MIHPDFVRGDSRCTFRNENVLAVWRPGRRYKIARRVFRNLFRSRSIGMNDPNVVAAFPVGEKRNPLPIRRKLGLAVKCHSAGNQFRLSAFYRQRVKVAEQLKYDIFAVWRNVEREPCAFIGRKLDFAVALQRQRLLLVLFLVFLFFLLLFFLFLRRGEAQRRQQTQRHGQSHRPHRPPGELARDHCVLLQIAVQRIQKAPFGEGTDFALGPTPCYAFRRETRGSVSHLRPSRQSSTTARPASLHTTSLAC